MFLKTLQFKIKQNAHCYDKSQIGLLRKIFWKLYIKNNTRPCLLTIHNKTIAGHKKIYTGQCREGVRSTGYISLTSCGVLLHSLQSQNMWAQARRGKGYAFLPHLIICESVPTPAHLYWETTDGRKYHFCLGLQKLWAGICHLLWLLATLLHSHRA